jgi:UDP-N-acetylmuramate--alanine ligase
MIVSILRNAGSDPTYLVGGGLNDAGTNAASGSGDVIVAESDESDGSFLLLDPHVAVITNVEADHLDFWKDFAHMKQGFVDFMGRIQAGGAAVVPITETDLIAAAGGRGVTTYSFGPGGEIWADNVAVGPDATSFLLRSPSGSAPIILKARGMHNVLNGLAAAGAALAVGLSVGDIAKGLAAFGGVERRWQLRGTVKGVTVIDDYAHHPTEVRATVGSARPGPWRRVVAVFQPHRYSRTQVLWSEFGSSFAGADQVVLTDVYGAGETPVPGVTGKLVADAICSEFPGRPVAYLPHRHELVAYLTSHVREGDVVLTLGAGDITSLGEELLQRLEQR